MIELIIAICIFVTVIAVSIAAFVILKSKKKTQFDDLVAEVNFILEDKIPLKERIEKVQEKCRMTKGMAASGIYMAFDSLRKNLQKPE